MSDAVWSAQGTTPDEVEAALRELVTKRHSEQGGYAPARALNMIAFVESGFAGEIANRLRGVGRYHASRTLVFSYEAARTRMDARAIVSTEREPQGGELGLLRETVVVEIGERHLDDLVTIADPLVVTDLATLVWSPHGYLEAVEALLELAQAVLIDSLDEPSWREAIKRSCELQHQAYVVDLAWLRSTPWRERLAAAFDPNAMRGELNRIEALSIEHHPESTVSAMLFVGWLASRLGWQPEQLRVEDDVLRGVARAGEHEVRIALRQAPEQHVRGLRGVTIETGQGRRLGWRRGEGGLRARSRDGQGREHEWTVLGASRGEGGILGEGIRQALLRDPTYTPALRVVEAMTP